MSGLQIKSLIDYNINFNTHNICINKDHQKQNWRKFSGTSLSPILLTYAFYGENLTLSYIFPEKAPVLSYAKTLYRWSEAIVDV